MTNKYLFSLASVALLAMSVCGSADAARRVKSVRQNAPASGWVTLGTGMYHDELLISYGLPAEDWKVTIEQNSDKPGWYRFIPYNENSSAAEILGPDDEYMYINATNPKKVYAEDFNPYGGTFNFSNVVVENDWDESFQYGTLVDGVISWPTVNTWASYDNGWFYLSFQSGPMLFLPGSEFKDYSMDLVTEHYCTEDNLHDLLLLAGDDVASFKYISLPGNHDVLKLEDLVAEQGVSEPVDGGGAFITIDLNNEKPGIYTTMIVALDADGKVRNSKQTQFIVNDNDHEWLELGKTEFGEPLYWGCYDDFSHETLSCTIYESKTTPGLYLLENPYLSHSELAAELTEDHSHHAHGIIVNATDPEHVYVEPSAVGVCLDGDGAAWSLAGYYLAAGYDFATIEEYGFFGTKSLNADGTSTIEMPYGTLMLGEKNYYWGEFIDCDAPFDFVVPAVSEQNSIANISDSADSVEVYNLQGIRVPADTKGLVISRRGAKVCKHISL